MWVFGILSLSGNNVSACHGMLLCVCAPAVPLILNVGAKCEVIVLFTFKAYLSYCKRKLCSRQCVHCEATQL